MQSRKSAGKSAGKSPAFRFAPFSYPMRWAERAEDVPWWDALRGFPVQMSFTGMNVGESQNPEHQRKLWAMVGEGLEPLSDNCLPVNIYPCLVRGSLEPLYAAQAVNEVTVPKNPGSQPESKESEPVREPPHKGPDLLLVDEDKLLNGLARVGRMKGNTLRENVLELAQKYGFPESPNHNSLRDWEAAGWEVNTYMEALQALSEGGGLDYLRESEAGIIRAPAQEARTEQEFRQKVADFLLERFFLDGAMPWRTHRDVMMQGGQHITPLLRPRADVGQGRVNFVIRAGCLTYARYVLVQRFLERTSIHTCEVCGGPCFGNKGRKTCGKSCRDKKYEAGKKAGSR